MILRALLFCALCLSFPPLLKRDFKVPPTLSQIAFNPEWEIGEATDVKEILNQPFTYLARGNQAYVFESQNGEYVLKLFRYTRSRFPLIQNVKDWIAKQRHKKPKNDFLTKLNKTFQAAKIAYTDGKPFTQVVYCHLNLTANQLPATPFQAGRTYSLPLDRYRFVLQRKVSPFKATLLSAKGNPEEMHRLIDSFVTLVLERSATGIRNADPNLTPNFGFLNGKAVEIDFGNYRKPPFNPEERAAEVANLLHRLDQWLKKNAPEYCAYLDLNPLISYSPPE